ncbi:MAG TPA: hypothetical protein VJR89_39515 [Polyangiales bacterium]|nr:hypothetical protein [Polyangiales bacterium]
MSLTVCQLICAAGCGSDESSEMSGALKRDGSKLAACFSDADCKNDLICYGQITDSMMATAGFCTAACNVDPREDPFAPGNLCEDIEKLKASCSPEGECRVDCTGSGKGDGPCPSGMVCRDTDPSDMRVALRCAYPIGMGRGAKQSWEECSPTHGDADCSAPNVCVPFGNGANRRGFCSAPCTMDGECKAPNGVNARPLCAPQLEACSLDCTDGATCPAGMQCVDTTGGDTPAMRCRFVPAPARM